MPDPFAPKGWPRVAAAESRDQGEEFADRLRQLGASREEVTASLSVWGIDREDDARLRLMGDHELTRELARVRSEDRQHRPADEATMKAVWDEAGSRISGTVNEIVAWVGGDPDRAAAVVDLEAVGANRVTLLRSMNEVLV